ncbi:MAG TPA: ornithine carbamoyltransferase [Verrucomicrobiae bacterium]|nr:ornithine carbamoyltransferase [Verrucomicrobiae bacterium]
MGKRDLLNFDGLSRRDFAAILALAGDLKRKQKRGIAHRLLPGKGLALVFEKPSLRTRATFAVGMTQLGGDAIYLGPAEVGLGTRETPADCARNLDRWFDLITVRTFAHKIIKEMAEYSSVPVINALTDDFHPCQVLADCQTLIEHKGDLDGLKIAFVGDGNNMVHSWLEAAVIVPFSFALACPKGYEPDETILKRAVRAGADITITHAVEEALSNADAVYTDVWTSMGKEKETQARLNAFRPYQVNSRTVAMAKKDAVVMHCLPAHRGEEITHEVLESPQCVAFDQAENRLHVQKAIMVWLLNGPQEPKAPASRGLSKRKSMARKR